jgi:hypothetical protein
MKLQAYRKGVNTPARPQQDRRLAVDETAWADNILGLGTSNPFTQKRSLAAEVDAYFLDSQFGTNSLNYWQVSIYFCCVYFDYIILYRRINFVFQLYLPLLWTRLAGVRSGPVRVRELRAWTWTKPKCSVLPDW